MLLARSNAVLELGKRLVAQLEADDDLLASWMAHDIASRMAAVEAAEGEAKVEARNSCAAAILELWQHRNDYPRHLRPLGELEPTLRTLTVLDVDETDHAYFPEALRAAATAEAQGEAKQWLDFAIGLDYSARLLIRQALRSGAAEAAASAEPWVELARQAGAEEGVERPVIRFIVGKRDEERAGAAEARKALEDRVRRIDSFAKMANIMADDLRAQISADRADD